VEINVKAKILNSFLKFYNKLIFIKLISNKDNSSIILYINVLIFKYTLIFRKLDYNLNYANFIKKFETLYLNINIALK